ncbi:hypothetical protein BGZ83_000654 [Gryganskiella cystojenkinii]|nr:hypothetical protein BGZ83_000654 [Gryganskiella cystojenkinii]
MTRLSLVLLAIVASCAGLVYVHACEEECRGDPVTFLTKKYEAILEHQASMISDPKLADASRKLIPEVMSQLEGPDHVVDSTIFDLFRGTCPNPPGARDPTEFCGSAKAVACFAPWGHENGVFDNVHQAVLKVVEEVYKESAQENPEVQAAMVKGVKDFCPVNCDDWIEPFQNIMLVWEQREHPHQYKVTPNCLPLANGGI